MSDGIRRICAALLIIGGSIGAVGCGKAVKASASAITAKAAKRPFVARGFVVGCPNIAVGALPSFGIATRGAKSACEPNLGSMTVYRTTADARNACAPNAKYFCVALAYQVRNVAIGIDPSESTRIRQELMDALRTFGTPMRIA